MTGPRKRFQGIYPVLYALFDDRGTLDRTAMQAQVEHCIAAGAHGIMVLGLVTEVHKMDVNERFALVAMVGDLIARRVPYAVTIGEPTIAGQVAFAREAKQAGADWVILQPPTAGGGGEAEVVRFFGAVADNLDMPVAVQNNPVNLTVSLSPANLVALHRNHANITLLKGEGFSVDIARVIEGTDGAMDVFGGHGGLEFMALLRSGGRGLDSRTRLRGGAGPDLRAFHAGNARGAGRGGAFAQRGAAAHRLHDAGHPDPACLREAVHGAPARPGGAVSTRAHRRRHAVRPGRTRASVRIGEAGRGSAVGGNLAGVVTLRREGGGASVHCVT